MAAKVAWRWALSASEALSATAERISTIPSSTSSAAAPSIQKSK